MVTLKSFRIVLFWGLTLSLTLLFFTRSSTAQVLSDGDVGNPNVNSTLGTVVNQAGQEYRISGGTRPGDGPNLFHSFSQFDVLENHTALFLSATQALGESTANIFGRITDQNPSTIFGTIDSARNFPTASLWLMNPAGFVFGPNAALNVGGSFFVNNADAINFADGKVFTALPSAQDLSLSIEPAVALSFLEPNPNSEGIHFNGSNLTITGSIDAGGNLISGTGKISVVGRDGDNAKGVKVTGGSLTASLGQINLASVASGGELDIDTLEENPQNNGQTFTQLGQIELSQAAQVTAAAGGEQAIVIRAGVLTLEGGSRVNSVSTALGNGNVTIHADSVSAKDFAVVFNGFQFIRQPSGIFTFSLGGAKSGDVLINASSVELDNFASVGTPSFSLSPNSSPTGGNITFEVDTFTASNFAVINSSTNTVASAGDITIRGRGGEDTQAEFVSLSSVASLQASTLGDGGAGDMSIQAKSLDIDTFGFIQADTFGNGNGGDIHVQVDALDIDTGSISAGSGAIDLTSDVVTAGTGRGGNITIHAATKATLSNGATIQADTAAQGDASLGAGAGTLMIQTPDLEVNAGAAIRSQTSSDRAAGNLIVEADQVSLNGGSLNANSGFVNPNTGVVHVGSGQAGDITIRGQDGENSKAKSVSLSNGAALQSLTSGGGGAGDMSIQAKSLDIDTFGFIQADTFGNGNGGDIHVQVDALDIDTGSISAGSGAIDLTSDVVTAGTGRGGNITIHAATKATLSNGATIQADTAAQGDASLGAGAGTLMIQTPDLEVNAGAAIRSQTSSDRAAGNLIVEADQVSLNGGSLNANSGFVNPNTGVVHVGSGQAGDITIRGKGGEDTAAQNVSLSNGASLVASTLGNGGGGDIGIQANSLDINTLGSIQADTFGDGDAGDITIGTARVNIEGVDDPNPFALPNTGITASTFGQLTTGEGGDITITASEQVALSSLAEIRSTTNGLGKGGTMTINTEALEIIDRSGLSTSTFSFFPQGRAGDILIQGAAGTGSKVQAVNLAGGSIIQAATFGNANAGEVAILAEDLTASGSGTTINSSSSFLGSGNAGNVSLLIDNSLAISNGAQIQSATAGSGNAGNLVLEAGNATIAGVGQNGFASGLFVNAESLGTNAEAGKLDLTVTNNLTISDGGGIFGITFSNGKGADVKVTAGSINLESGGAIATSSLGEGKDAGDAGTITVEATSGPINISGSLDTNRPIEPVRKSFMKSGVFSNAAKDPREDPNTVMASGGNAGVINISTPGSINITNQGTLSTSTAGNGDGGELIVNAGQNVSLINAIVKAESESDGNAGNISINAGNTMNIQNTKITSESKGAGQGGTITLNANGENTLNLNNSIITALVNNFDQSDMIADGVSKGLANIKITSPTINIEGSAITTKSEGTRNAGGVEINAANTLNLLGNSTVSAEADVAQAGDLSLDANNLLLIQDSTVTSSVQGGAGTEGGDISIGTNSNPALIIQNSSIVTTAVEGNGGDVNFEFRVRLIDPFSTIDVSSQFGTSGTVTESGPIQNLSGAIAPLPEEIVDLASLVGQHCAAQKGGQLSSFVEAGRDVVPPGPADFLTSPLFLEQSQAGNVQGANKGVGTLAAQRLGMGLGEELQITSIMKMADSSVRTRCLL